MQPTDVLYKHKKSESLEKTPMTPIETPQVNYFAIEFFLLKEYRLYWISMCCKWWYDISELPLKAIITYSLQAPHGFKTKPDVVPEEEGEDAAAAGKGQAKRGSTSGAEDEKPPTVTQPIANGGFSPNATPAAAAANGKQ